MIIVKITGGLGNQLFQYAIGRALSLKLDCELVLDTSFYPQQTLREYELDKFHIKSRLATSNELKKAGAGKGLTYRLIRKLGLISKFYPQYIEEFESVTYVNAIDRCERGSYLQGYWQNPDYFKQCKNQLSEDLTPVSLLSEHAKSWICKINSTNSVSLHVRRGDYVESAHTNSVHGTCSIEYYKNAVKNIRQKIESPVFYIFSDDISWCKENFGFVKDAHFIADTVTAIDDLSLMRACQHNIIANSTFSWWGAWLGNDGVVVAPEKWFADSSRATDSLLPAGWVRI